MSSTIIKPLGQALADLGNGLTLENGIQVKGYLWERPDFDQIPAVAVQPPAGRRTALDEGEGELGSLDWYDEFLVRLYVDAHHAVTAQEQMVELLELFCGAVDDNYTLGSALVDDCKVTGWEPFARQTENRSLMGYECTVAVHHRVADI